MGRVVLAITFNYLMWKISHTAQRSPVGKCTGSISIAVAEKETRPHQVWEGQRGPQSCGAVCSPVPPERRHCRCSHQRCGEGRGHLGCRWAAWLKPCSRHRSNPSHQQAPPNPRRGCTVVPPSDRKEAEAGVTCLHSSRLSSGSEDSCSFRSHFVH